MKFKKLVGGRSMQIVNQTIPRALKMLGYADETVEAITSTSRSTVRDRRTRPEAEHYEVLTLPMGQRAIKPMGQSG